MFSCSEDDTDILRYAVIHRFINLSPECSMSGKNTSAQNPGEEETVASVTNWKVNEDT
jgi:hypothetical protein